LQVLRADLPARPEVEGRVLEVLGDVRVSAPLEEEAGLPVVAEPEPLDLGLLAQDDGEPGTAFDLLALDLDGLVPAHGAPGGLAIEARRRPVEVTGLIGGDGGHRLPSWTWVMEGAGVWQGSTRPANLIPSHVMPPRDNPGRRTQHVLIRTPASRPKPPRRCRRSPSHHERHPGSLPELQVQGLPQADRASRHAIGLRGLDEGGAARVAAAGFRGPGASISWRGDPQKSRDHSLHPRDRTTPDPRCHR